MQHATGEERTSASTAGEASEAPRASVVLADDAVLLSDAGEVDEVGPRR